MPPDDRNPNRIKFDYIKSNFFRVVHVDGAFGGVSPSGKVQIAVYNERSAIPRTTVHEVAPDTGRVQTELPEERIARDAIVREVEVELLMDPSTARALHRWLGTHLDHLDRLEAADKDSKPNTGGST